MNQRNSTIENYILPSNIDLLRTHIEQFSHFQSYYRTIVNAFLKVWMDTWTDKRFSNKEFSTNSKKSKHTHIKQINFPSTIIDFTSLHDWSLTALWKKLACNQFHNILGLFDVFSSFSFPRKRNDMRLLLINIVYTSYLTSFQTD